MDEAMNDTTHTPSSIAWLIGNLIDEFGGVSVILFNIIFLLLCAVCQ
jgi:hypothetical protein